MARKPRIHFAGAIYHVTQRGVNRAPIFLDEADRRRFLDQLDESIEAAGVRLFLFCLMPNHFHLLVETPQANLSAFMQRVQTAYTLYFNARHQRTGHLMQGRYGAMPVQGDRYLLNLSRYVHLNPVAVSPAPALPAKDRVGPLRKFVWSSFRGYAGLAPSYEFVDEGPILALTPGEASRRRAEYRRFVEAGLKQIDDEWLAAYRKARWGLGDERFQSQVRQAQSGRTESGTSAKDSGFRQTETPVAPAKILQKAAEEFGVSSGDLKRRGYRNRARGAALLMLVRHGGLTQREAAVLLDVGTGAAASQQLAALRAARAADPELAGRLERLAAAIRAEPPNS